MRKLEIIAYITLSLLKHCQVFIRPVP